MKPKRPLYDPLIESLNDKARDAVDARRKAIKTEDERILQSSEGRTRALVEHGHRINPNKTSLAYLGSFCVHIYENQLGAELQFICLDAKNPNNRGPSQFGSRKAIEQLTFHAMEKYGHGPKATLDRRKEKNESLTKDL